MDYVDYIKDNFTPISEAWNPEFIDEASKVFPLVTLIDLENLYFEQKSREFGYICKYKLTLEEEGGYSIECVNLPGVNSCGNFILDCHYMIMDAFEGAIECYLEKEWEIPWEQ